MTVSWVHFCALCSSCVLDFPCTRSLVSLASIFIMMHLLLALGLLTSTTLAARIRINPGEIFVVDRYCESNYSPYIPEGYSSYFEQAAEMLIETEFGVQRLRSPITKDSAESTSSLLTASFQTYGVWPRRAYGQYVCPTSTGCDIDLVHLRAPSQYRGRTSANSLEGQL